MLGAAHTMAVAIVTLPESGHGFAESARDQPSLSQGVTTGRSSPCPQRRHQSLESGRNCADRMIL